MTGRVDPTLRELLARGAPALVRQITGAEMVAALPTEFPETRDRRVDTLVRLDDGRLLHIEWQTGFDAAMPRRMLEYWLAISGTYPNQPVVQVVIQTGGKPIPGHLAVDRVRFDYRVLDSRDLDPTPLLASPAVEDKLLAILAGRDNLQDTVSRILRGLARLPARAFRDALAQLLALATLRKATHVVRKEVTTMPLIIDLEADPYFAGLLEQSRMEGIREGERRAKSQTILQVLESKFGPLPGLVEQKINTSDIVLLDKWLNRAIHADSLDLVFLEDDTISKQQPS